MLFLLPDCLSRLIIGEWLPLKAIARLDSAVCGLCRHEAFAISHRLTLDNDKVASWILLRGFVVQNIALFSTSRSLSPMTIRNFVQTNASTITSVEMNNYDPATVSMINECCHTLTNFTSWGVDFFGLSKLLERNSTTLQVLTVDMIDGDVSAFCSNSLPQLTSLTSLEMRLTQVAQVLLIQTLAALTPRLQKLRVHLFDDRVADTPFPGIDASCLHLRTLTLCNVPIAATAFNTMLRLCPNIVNLEIVNLALNDDSVLILTTSLRFLRFVRLARCGAITDNSLVHLSTHCGNALQSVWLEQMTNITRAGMDTFRTRCPGVALQYVEQCWSTRDLEKVLSQNKTTILNISFNMINADLLELASTSDSVRVVWLCISHHGGLSPAGFVGLCSKMPQLHTLVCHVFRYSLVTIREWMLTLPHITVTSSKGDSDLNVMDLPI